jgi:organic radical activating enzyme
MRSVGCGFIIIFFNDPFIGSSVHIKKASHARRYFMEGLTPPTKVLGVTLLYKCNFKCAHCGYLYVDDSVDHDIKPGYRMTWDQIQRLIADCNSIKDETFAFVLNGGEPTLWEEEDLKFIDVLLAVAEGGIYPTYNTNGSYFVEYDRCHDFFRRYTEEAKMPLKTFVSMDKFHDNYDRERERADSLNNIVKVLAGMAEDKRKIHQIHVVTIISKDPASFLPPGMKEYYGARGITFGDFPMQAIGRARDLMDEMPESQEFFKNAPPPPKGSGGYPIGSLIGENYVRHGRKVAKLGNLKELLALAVADA